MKAYDYQQTIIDNLNQINSNGDNFYNYKGLNFLAKIKSKNTNLIVFFHGAVRGYGKDRIIFRGYNYSYSNTDIICISDYLMNIYDEYQVNWCLSSAKYDAQYICKELFKYLIDLKSYSNVIFTGSSAGCYPSLYFACYFNSIALFSNPQLYLEKYGFAQRNSKNPWGFYGLAKMLVGYNDAIIYEPKTIETHILKYKPKKIIIYNNKLDTHTLNEHTLPFVNFLEKNNLTHLLELNVFKGNKPPEGKTDHEINFPPNTSYFGILKNLIESLK